MATSVEKTPPIDKRLRNVYINCQRARRPAVNIQARRLQAIRLVRSTVRSCIVEVKTRSQSIQMELEHGPIQLNMQSSLLAIHSSSISSGKRVGRHTAAARSGSGRKGVVGRCLHAVASGFVRALYPFLNTRLLM